MPKHAQSSPSTEVAAESRPGRPKLLLYTTPPSPVTRRFLSANRVVNTKLKVCECVCCILCTRVRIYVRPPKLRERETEYLCTSQIDGLLDGDNLRLPGYSLMTARKWLHKRSRVKTAAACNKNQDLVKNNFYRMTNVANLSAFVTGQCSFPSGVHKHPTSNLSE
jgi:hypothetical protein